MMKKGVWAAGVVLFVVALLWTYVRRPPQPIQSQTRFLLDTYCTIQVPGEIDVIPAIECAFARIEEVEIVLVIAGVDYCICQLQGTVAAVCPVSGWSAACTGFLGCLLD